MSPTHPASWPTGGPGTCSEARRAGAHRTPGQAAGAARCPRRAAAAVVLLLATVGCQAPAGRAPSAVFDLTRTATGWRISPQVDARPGVGLRVSADGQGASTTVVAPVSVPEEVPVTVEAVMRLPDRWGSAGVFCRGTAEAFGYALVVSRAGGWWLLRGDGGEVENGGIDPADLAGDEPVRLHLTCGAPDGGGVPLAISYDGRHPIRLEDHPPSRATSGTGAGVVVIEDIDLGEETTAVVERFAVRPPDDP